MNNTIDAFTAVVEQIIRQELDSIQQDQYTIEGYETITSLFENYSLPEYEDVLVADFGFVPSNMELHAAGISFLDVITSCFNLVEANKEITSVDEKERLYVWKETLIQGNTNPLLADLLCEKYKDRINEISLP